MPDKKYVNYLVVAFSAILYFYLFYYVSRADSLLLVGTYSLLFIGYLLLLKNNYTISIRWLLAISLLFRIIPLFALPALSDDVYRFIWDGRLWAAGINPFAGLPTDFLNNPQLLSQGINNELFSLLNSPTHYTIYPPIPQYINWLAAKLFADNIYYSIILIRTTTIVTEIISIYLLFLLLKRYSMKPSMAVIYALNPLVIIELAGNLHHEAFMVTFLLAFMLFNSQKKHLTAAIMLALAVTSKLLPLMFLPLILLKEKRRVKFLLVFTSATIILFLPLLEASFFTGMLDSLSLYYQTFEFNAGFYYLLREVGYWLYGYNTIAVIGKLLLVTSTIILLAISFRLAKKQATYYDSFTILYLIFTLFALILHPWYIILLIALAPFTRFKFPLVWSYLIFLTYLGYSQSGFSENYYVVGVEFVTVLTVLVYDLQRYARLSLNLNEAP